MKAALAICHLRSVYYHIGMRILARELHCPTEQESGFLLYDLGPKMHEKAYMSGHIDAINGGYN